MNNAIGIKKNRLLYYMHDGAAAFRLELSGDLSRDGIEDLEQAWGTASSMLGERRLVIDLSYVTGVDATGRELLNRWHSQGARLVTVSAETQARVESLTELPVTLVETSPRVFTWLPVRTSPLWLAPLLALLLPATVGAPTQARVFGAHGGTSPSADESQAVRISGPSATPATLRS